MTSCAPSTQSNKLSPGRARPKNQGHVQNLARSRRAKPQGPRETGSASHYETFRKSDPRQDAAEANDSRADLRFLNHNKPPLTPASILDPASVNSNNMQQLQALKEAEAWFSRTALMLQERLELCEKMQTGLKQVNILLAAIQAETANPGDVEETKQDDLQEVEPKQDSLQEAEPSGDPDQTVKDVDADIKSMEEAVKAWLQDIRVSRARWIAGGIDMERRIGLR